MQTLIDVLALAVMFGVFSAAAVCAGWYLIALTARRTTRMAAFALIGVNLVAFLGFWYFWGEGFDYADANRVTPYWVDLGEGVAVVLCVATTVSLLALALRAAGSRARARTA